jgi:hypothetical protein
VHDVISESSLFICNNSVNNQEIGANIKQKKKLSEGVFTWLATVGCLFLFNAVNK